MQPAKRPAAVYASRGCSTAPSRNCLLASATAEQRNAARIGDDGDEGFCKTVAVASADADDGVTACHGLSCVDRVGDARTGGAFAVAKGANRSRYFDPFTPSSSPASA